MSVKTTLVTAGAALLLGWVGGCAEAVEPASDETPDDVSDDTSDSSETGGSSDVGSGGRAGSAPTVSGGVAGSGSGAAASAAGRGGGTTFGGQPSAGSTSNGGTQGGEEPDAGEGGSALPSRAGSSGGGKPNSGGAGSGGTVSAGSGGTVSAGSGGTVSAGSGGTVSAGSGGTTSAGSGSTPTGKNLFQGSGFEGSTTEGWAQHGTAVLALSTTEAHTGTQSLSVSGRNQSWHGAEYNVLGVVTPGVNYRISMWAKLAAGESGTLILTRQLQGCDVAEFVRIKNETRTTDSQWVDITGTLLIPSTCAPTRLVVFVEGSTADLAYFIDDVWLEEL